MNAIPTNLFTGFLGVGKSTAILHLLARKPASERWAVLVNEYGDVGIDAVIMEGSGLPGVTVREVSGGCFCCTTAPYLPVALHFLLVDARPDRLLIESSGLGHPARLIDTLRANYADRLDVRATVGLADPRDLALPGMRENRVFLDQMHLADVLVLNKLDEATAEEVRACQEWAQSLYPPKLLIAGTTQGQLEPAWLDLAMRDEILAMAVPEDHLHGGLPAEGQVKEPRPGHPVRVQSSPGTCGWIFHPQDEFTRESVLDLLQSIPGTARLKGILHTPSDWLVVNRVGEEMSVQPTAYRRDSRLEIIAGASGIDWDQLEQRLMGARK